MAKNTIFSEPQVDITYLDMPKIDGKHRILGVEYLPGQYDQRADSCGQCIQILTQKERPDVKTAKIYALIGDISDQEFDRIKNYLINPVESRQATLEKPKTLAIKYDIPTKVDIVQDFIRKSKKELLKLMDEYSLAMDLDDIIFCQKYFSEQEKRNPTVTEIKMIDTYWSDHCRHTTFLTKITDVKISDEYIEKIYQNYLKHRQVIHLGKKKDICLMDMATIGMKILKKAGKLKNLDESDEINACSVKIVVDVDKEKQEWL
jgi:phosphoribosylformylglycinamidine synthase